MEMLSCILGTLLGGGVIALIIVFQQEIRKFLLLLGSSNITNNKNILKKFNLFFKISSEQTEMDLDELNSAIGEAEAGIIVQVQDEEDGEEVLIYVD